MRSLSQPGSIKSFARGLGFTFLFLWAAEYLPISKILESRGNDCICRHQLEFFMFGELIGCCLQQCGLAVNLRKVAYSLGNSLGCLEIFMRPIWPKIQLDSTQSWYWSFASWQVLANWDFISTLFGWFIRIDHPGSSGASLSVSSWLTMVMYIHSCIQALEDRSPAHKEGRAFLPTFSFLFCFVLFETGRGFSV